jgi:hypothetical protein
LEENIITSQQLGIIKGQIENPSYDYKSPDSAWELYSHATHAIKVGYTYAMAQGS